MSISVREYGSLSNGEVIHEYTLSCRQGTYARILDYGGIIVGYHVRDRQGQMQNIVLELANLKQYELDSFYMGAIIGRFANRIAHGKLVVDGKEYNLTINNKGNHLHGGITGFHKVKWNAIINDSTLQLTYISVDGEEGYPGELTTHVTYELNDEGELIISSKAHTTKPTHLNITFHSYFNLDGSHSILDHILSLNANHYLPINANQIPIGSINPVDNTGLDFSKETLISDRVFHPDVQMVGGIDHTYVLSHLPGMQKASTLRSNVSGIQLEVFTTEPGIQVYTGNFLSDVKGKTTTYDRHAGICIEPQHFPDTPNQNGFPSTYLKPGNVFESKTLYRVKLQEC